MVGTEQHHIFQKLEFVESMQPSDDAITQFLIEMLKKNGKLKMSESAMVESQIFKMKPIGIIHTPFKVKEETPIQPSRSVEVEEVEVYKEYEDGLKDVEGFTYLILLYAFHRS